MTQQCSLPAMQLNRTPCQLHLHLQDRASRMLPQKMQLAFQLRPQHQHSIQQHKQRQGQTVMSQLPCSMTKTDTSQELPELATPCKSELKLLPLGTVLGSPQSLWLPSSKQQMLLDGDRVALFVCTWVMSYCRFDILSFKGHELNVSCAKFFL